MKVAKWSKDYGWNYPLIFVLNVITDGTPGLLLEVGLVMFVAAWIGRMAIFGGNQPPGGSENRDLAPNV
jgi:hypothetical protein